MSDSLSNVRKDYDKGALEDANLPETPYELFSAWITKAKNLVDLDYNAMQLTTVGEDAYPQSRIVLLRRNDERGPVFFTNFKSAKGNQIAHDPKGSIAFFWKELERQIRITGKIEKVEDVISDDYFASRPRESQLGAWASDQSQPIANRAELEAKVKEVAARFEGKEVPRPPHWGGYRMLPHRYEFWQGRASRLHDRICFEKEGGSWKISRLQP